MLRCEFDYNDRCNKKKDYTPEYLKEECATCRHVTQGSAPTQSRITHACVVCEREFTCSEEFNTPHCSLRSCKDVYQRLGVYYRHYYLGKVADLLEGLCHLSDTKERLGFEKGVRELRKYIQSQI